MESKQLIEKLIPPVELAALLGLKKSVVYRMLRAGQIPCVRVTNGERRLSLRVRPKDLQKWLCAREVGR